METLLLFLANALSSSAIGHYVGKGLSTIDNNLPELLSNNHEIDKACKIIYENSLEGEILKFADEVKRKMDITNNENILNFNGTNNEGVVANIVTIKTFKKNIKTSAPQGSISSSLNHKNYIKHLIDRYHEYKLADVGKDKIKYPVFYGAIKREFGAKWDMIPLHKFLELSSFIQGRIDKTILGKKRKSEKSKCYSSYEEYLAKHVN
jgi:hypothetical protein